MVLLPEGSVVIIVIIIVILGWHPVECARMWLLTRGDIAIGNMAHRHFACSLGADAGILHDLGC